MAEPMSETDGGGKGSGGKTMGLPNKLLLPAAVLLALVGYLMYTRSKNAQAAAQQAQLDQSQQYGPAGLPPNYPDAQTLYSQLLNLQYQVSNLANGQQGTPGSGGGTTQPPGYSLLPYKKTSDTDMLGLNELADIVNTTPQAIIDNTVNARSTGGTWTTNSPLAKYFSAGNFDDPLPDGAELYVPILAPPGQGAQLGGTTGDLVPTPYLYQPGGNTPPFGVGTSTTTSTGGTSTGSGG